MVASPGVGSVDADKWIPCRSSDTGCRIYLGGEPHPWTLLVGMEFCPRASYFKRRDDYLVMAVLWTRGSAVRGTSGVWLGIPAPLYPV